MEHITQQLKTMSLMTWSVMSVKITKDLFKLQLVLQQETLNLMKIKVDAG